MLIICQGPDTFRALAKAQELESAFRKKYDAQGLSVERIASGKTAIAEIASRAGAISLFAPRRFVRTSQVLTEATKAQRALLKQTLAGDQEGFILLSVEEEPIAPSVLKEFDGVVKVVGYDFERLQGEAFFTWACEEAALLDLTDKAAIRSITQATEGDSWSCFFELLKRAAYSGAEHFSLEGSEGTVFSFADAFIARRSTWWELLSRPDLVKQASTAFLSQARAALRVRDQVTEGMHPFVVKKLRGQALDGSDELLGRAIEGFFAQRSGYGDEKECLTLF